MDAETLAVRLHRFAQEEALRVHSLQEQLKQEESTSVLLDREIAELGNELEEYRGWLSDELEGSEAFLLSKSLVEERDRRELLDKECVELRSKLGSISELVRQLSAQGERRKENAADLDQITSNALEALARLKESDT